MEPQALFESDDTDWLTRPDAKVEGPWVERKEWCDAADIARHVSGFANGTREGGLFVLGVSKEGRIVGVDDKGNAVHQRLEQLHSLVEGSWDHRFVPVRDGGDRLLYIFVRFSLTRVVCTSDGHAYRRIGASTRKLGPTELRELRYERGELSFEDEPAVPWHQDRIDEELAAQYLQSLRDRNGLTLPLTLEDAARNRHLAIERADGLHLTHAGLLALGRSPTAILGGARLRFLRFDGVEDVPGTARNVVKDRWFEGAIPRIVPAFRDFMRDQVKEFDYLGQDGLFQREPEYPQEAWEEAVVNALVHRAYSLRNACVFVRMFDDRVEVESPGSFPGPVGADKVPRQSYPRNPHLADALQCFQLVRLAQEGTRRMISAMEAMRLPAPLFEERDGGQVRVTLRNDIEHRRGRFDTGQPSQAWEVVERELGDELALYRGSALSEWERLQASGATPPASVLAVALEQLASGVATDREADWLAKILGRHPDEVTRAFAVALVGRVLSGTFAHERQSLPRWTGLVASSDEVVSKLLKWLERAEPQEYSLLKERNSPPFLHEFVFALLRSRVERHPPPAKELVQRVLAQCVRFREVPGAVQLYGLITGKSL